jgi:hypothetical protein
LLNKAIIINPEMNTLRQMMGKIRSDNVTTQDIRQQCGIQPIGEWV